MHTYFSDRVIYTGDPESFLTYLEPNFAQFSGSLVRVDDFLGDYVGYDDWVSHFSRQEEVEIIAESIKQVKLSPKKRIHICGISTAESVECVRRYYRECGYEDALAKNYMLPADTALTVGISLSHALWCEKDKTFLDSRGVDSTPYGHISPPLRSPHDLRSLQQALRMGVIMGIEISPREVSFVSEILKRQIIPPFLLSQMMYFRWQKHGFTGIKTATHFSYPDFSENNSDN